MPQFDWMADFSRPLTSGTARLSRSGSGLTEEEEESLLRSLASDTLSGIGWLGETLDKPGAAVRGIASGLTGGDWGGGLLNLIPFSDSMGLTSPEEKVTGRELLETWGALGPNQEGLDWGDAAGFGAEMLLDPLAWFTLPLGALGRGGQVASKAGILDDVLRAGRAAGTGRRVTQMQTTLGDAIGDLSRIGPTAAQGRYEKATRAAEGMGLTLDSIKDQPLGGLVGLSKTPVIGRSEWTFGHGDIAQKVGGWLDTAGEAIRYSKPVSLMAANFDRALKGATKRFSQEATSQASKFQAEGTAAVRGRGAGYLRELHGLGLLDESLQPSRLRPYLEGITDELPEEFLPGKAIFDRMRAEMPEVLEAEQRMGLPTKKLRDDYPLPRDPDTGKVLEYPDLPPAKGDVPLLDDALPGTIEDYFPRQLFRFGKREGPRGSQAAPGLSTANPYTRQREELLTGWRGGTDPLNQASIDPKLSGTWTEWDQATRKMNQQQKALYQTTKRADAVKHIRATYPDLAATADAMEDGDAALSQLADWLSKLDPQHAQKGIPAFGNHPVYDMMSRLEHGEQAKGSARAIYEMLGGQAARFDEMAAAGGTPVKVTDVLRTANLTGKGAHARFDDVFESKWLPEKLGTTRPTIDELYVPADVAGEVSRVMKPFQAPEEISTLVQAWDKVTNLFRSHVTTPWPAFHVRNLLSGQVQNALGGATDPFTANPVMKLVQPIRDAWSLVRGGTIKDVTKIPYIRSLGITDPKKATEAIADLVYAHEVTGRFQGYALDVGEDLMGGRQLGDVPGLEPVNIRQSLKDLKPTSRAEWNPLNVRGVGSEEDLFFVGRAGRAVGKATEDMNRISPFIALLKQGVDPAVAAKRVKDMQVDYLAGAAGDKVMRRIFPFWSFAKGMGTFTAKELAQKPGGALAQTIRMQNRSRGEGQFLPDYVARTLAIGLPSGPTGAKRLLSGMGLMHEDPASFLGGGLRGGLQEMASRLNPMIKAPIEYATGRSFFQAGPRGGRALDDMDAPTGRLMSNVANLFGAGLEDPVNLPGGTLTEHVLSNSPLARYITTAKGLTDQRKGLGIRGINALSGARITDLPPRTIDALIRSAATDRLMGTGAGRLFEKAYIPGDALEGIGPSDRLEAEQLMALLNLLGKRSGQRAKGEPVDLLGGL